MTAPAIFAIRSLSHKPLGVWPLPGVAAVGSPPSLHMEQV
jgi:hypothetical protein